MLVVLLVLVVFVGASGVVAVVAVCAVVVVAVSCLISPLDLKCVDGGKLHLDSGVKTFKVSLLSF